MPAKTVRLAVLFLMVSATAGCSTIGYYSQAVKGHFEIMSQARPVSELLADPRQPAELRDRLIFAQDVRDFVSQELGLPDNNSYRSYADIGRPYVVWNVIATEPLSVEPKRWCFLVLGCVSYRGYFSKQAAEAYAEELRGQGYDVYVAGATAYSTLGWFDDPLLNTILARQGPDLVALMAHELAHQQLYIAGDTEFNEALAVMIAKEGVRRWFAARSEPKVYRRYQEQQTRREQFNELLLTARERLKRTFSDPELDDQAKTGEKQRIFAQLHQEYSQLREQWGGYGGYDKWMAQDLGNAHLALVATYNALVPAFEVLLALEQGEMQGFLKRAHALGKLPRNERHIQLQALMELSNSQNLAQSESAEPDSATVEEPKEEES